MQSHVISVKAQNVLEVPPAVQYSNGMAMVMVSVPNSYLQSLWMIKQSIEQRYSMYVPQLTARIVLGVMFNLENMKSGKIVKSIDVEELL